MDASQILLAPIVSEKSYAGTSAGKYTFRVHEDAHRTQVRQSVEKLFDVQVERVAVVQPSELEIGAVVWARSLLVTEAALPVVEARAK